VSDLLERLQELVERGEVRVSEHGYDELADDGVTAREAVLRYMSYGGSPKGMTNLPFWLPPIGRQ